MKTEIIKVNVEGKTGEEIDFIIAVYDNDFANRLGYKFALPLIEGDELKIKLMGEAHEEEEKVSTLGQGLWGKTEADIAALNRFEA